MVVFCRLWLLKMLVGILCGLLLFGDIFCRWNILVGRLISVVRLRLERLVLLV